MSTLPGEARSRPSSVTSSPDQQNYADRELHELYEIANQLLESELDENPRVVPYGTTLRTFPTEDRQRLLRQLPKELPFQDNKAVAEHRKHGLPARQDQGSTISQNGGQPRSQRLDWPARHVSTSIQAIQETSPGSIFRQFARPASATEPDVHGEKPTTDGRYQSASDVKLARSNAQELQCIIPPQSTSNARANADSHNSLSTKQDEAVADSKAYYDLDKPTLNSSLDGALLNLVALYDQDSDGKELKYADERSRSNTCHTP